MVGGVTKLDRDTDKKEASEQVERIVELDHLFVGHKSIIESFGEAKFVLLFLKFLLELPP